MNEKLEAFRKRLRGPKKEKTNWQLWIGSPTAWLALMISSATAFYNLFYYSDQLSVVVPTSNSQITDRTFEVPNLRQLTFINSGTRPVAVLSIQMFVQQPSQSRVLGTDKRNCFRGGPRWIIDLEFDATVVKPYDTIVKEVRLPKDRSLITSDQPIDAPKSPENLPLFACLDFEVIATDTPVVLKRIEMDVLWFKNHRGG